MPGAYPKGGAAAPVLSAGISRARVPLAARVAQKGEMRTGAACQPRLPRSLSAAGLPRQLRQPLLGMSRPRLVLPLFAGEMHADQVAEPGGADESALDSPRRSLPL